MIMKMSGCNSGEWNTCAIFSALIHYVSFFEGYELKSPSKHKGFNENMGKKIL